MAYRAYHYTTFYPATQIIQTGMIRLSTKYKNEDQAVWFSTNADYEPGMGTAIVDNRTGRIRHLSRDEIVKWWGVARFVTDAALLTPYAQFVAEGRMRPEAAQKNELFAAQHGISTGDWYVFQDDFPLRLCIGAELLIDGQWERMTPTTIKQLFDQLPNGFGRADQGVWRQHRRKPRKRKRKRDRL